MTTPAIQPGARLLELLAARDWSQGDLAEIIARPLQMVNEVIGGKKQITRETAAQLGTAFDTGAMYWLTLQDAYHLEQLCSRTDVTVKLEQIRQRVKEKEMMTTTTAPRPVCPECRDGKHANCIGYALDAASDVVVSCACSHCQGV